MLLFPAAIRPALPAFCRLDGHSPLRPSGFPLIAALVDQAPVPAKCWRLSGTRLPFPTCATPSPLLSAERTGSRWRARACCQGEDFKLRSLGPRRRIARRQVYLALASIPTPEMRSLYRPNAQSAIRHLFRVVKEPRGNLPALPAIAWRRLKQEWSPTCGEASGRSFRSLLTRSGWRATNGEGLFVAKTGAS